MGGWQSIGTFLQSLYKFKRLYRPGEIFFATKIIRDWKLCISSLQRPQINWGEIFFLTFYRTLNESVQPPHGVP